MKHTLGTLRLTEETKQALLRVLDTNWLSPGKNVRDLEEKFSGLHGNKYGQMTNSGTDALRIALLALKEKYRWNDGDLVLCPAVTFVATVNAVLQAGLTPELVDVSMYDFNLSADNLEWRLKTSAERHRIKAVMPVHLGGQPCDMARIKLVADHFKLRVLEDSCECLGVEGIAGAGTDVTCFSFYAAHLLVTGVGGIAVTNDEGLHRLMWSYANHGRREAKRFIFDRIGYSCRATELEAVLGLQQLSGLKTAIARRRYVYASLFEGLSEFPELFIPVLQANSACLFLPILLTDSCNRSKRIVMDHLNRQGIETRDLMPLTNQPCYRWDVNDYPVARDVNEHAFYIGTHPDVTDDQIDRTMAVFRQIFGKSRKNHATIQRRPKMASGPDAGTLEGLAPF